MNERIEKLSEQCQLETYGINGELLASHFDAQKFAELIVRECAKIAEDTQKFYDEHNDSVVNTEIWTMIKLHFGVEL
jgi:hypothetical protein